MPNTYDNGDVVRLSVAFTSGGSAVDPGTVTFRALKPNGSAVSYTYGADAELVKGTVGSYYVDLAADDDGTWYYRFAGAGTYQGAAEDRFLVKRSYIL